MTGMVVLLTEQKLRVQEKELNWKRTYSKSNHGHVELEVPEKHLLGNVGEDWEKLVIYT